MKTKKVQIVIEKNVFWEDWGKLRKVFVRGWVCSAEAHYDEVGNFQGVSAESPFFPGVSDGLSEDEYTIIREITDESME